MRVFGGDPRDARTRTRIGAVLQIARVPETLRVREHIHLFSSYYPNPMPIDDVIAAAGLQGLERRKFGELSGGQQKRVLFALAICGNPDLLVLDEPTVGLDVEARRALWKQIRAFIAGGKSVLLTTHYLAEAEALADRVVVIHHGNVVAEGTPRGDQRRRGDARRRIRRNDRVGLGETMRTYLLEIKYEFLKALRLPAYSLPTILFPVFFYLFFGVMFGGEAGRRR